MELTEEVDLWVLCAIAAAPRPHHRPETIHITLS